VQWLRIAAMALAPVVLATFVCVPMALERHPGEAKMASERLYWHMT
jgi:hypothetical protein